MARKGEYKYSANELEKKAEEYIKECKEAGKIPFLIGFANKLDVDQDTLTNWSKENTSYRRILKKVRRTGEQMLIDKALTENKPVFPIFLLKSVFGYSDMQKIDITSNGAQVGVVMLPERKSS
jgi:hypothetical protein